MAEMEGLDCRFDLELSDGGKGGEGWKTLIWEAVRVDGYKSEQ